MELPQLGAVLQSAGGAPGGEEEIMKWSGILVALVLGLGAVLSAQEAWADRGRGGDRFASRHDGFAHRLDGYSGRGRIIKPRHEVRRFESHLVPVHRRGRGGARIGLFIGAPLMWHWPAPYYAYPPPVVVAPPSLPPVYIERGYDTAPDAGYWYYCDRPEGYYPYIRECPGGWERVAPTPQ